MVGFGLSFQTCSTLKMTSPVKEKEYNPYLWKSAGPTVLFTLFKSQNDTRLSLPLTARINDREGQRIFQKKKSNGCFFQDTNHHGKCHAVPKKWKSKWDMR